MGFRRLRLVQAPGAVYERPARDLAYGAWDVLDAAVRHESLAEAVAGSTLVVGTSARPGPPGWSARELAEQGGGRSAGGAVSVVFGPEATGLSREELRLCALRVHVPADPEHPSLNLAQAVLLVAYEIRTAGAFGTAPAAAAPRPEGPPAAVAEVEQALGEFKEAATAIGYLNPQQPAAILAEWRRLFARAAPTEREVSLLRGLARQMAWAGRAVAKAAPRDR
jgi:TrmH family RNA methyltransferase